MDNLVPLLGVAAVFVFLFILYAISPSIAKAMHKNQQAPDASSVEVTQPSAPAHHGAVELVNVDDKTAACIMAIVSHESGIPLSELIFKTIKAV